jgi:site-specific recombinase XerD
MGDFVATYQAWWADLAARRPAKTARLYRYWTLRAVADTAWHPLEVGRAEIERYLTSLANQHRNAVHSALLDWFDFLYRRGIRAQNPLRDIDRPAGRRRRLKRSLSEDELRRLLIAMVYLGEGRQRWTGQRLAFTVIAGYSTGLRPGELLAISTEDLHLNGARSFVRVYRSKTDEEQIMPLSGAGRVAFGELAAGRSGRLSSIGVSQWWNRVRRAALEAGIDPRKARPYALRHSFAQHLRQRGVPPRVVSELMNHADPRSTMGYDVPDNDELYFWVRKLDEPTPMALFQGG